jgi:8-oxo-dGTP pyrophosphatase MutT (NUDIX family)
MKHTYGIAIVNEYGKILVTHPTGDFPDEEWTIPKGGGEPGETGLQSAIRETIEETTIDIRKMSGEIVELGSFRYETKNKILHAWAFFTDEYIDVKRLSCPSLTRYGYPEADGWKFVTIREGLRICHHTFKQYSRVIKDLLDE